MGPTFVELQRTALGKKARLDNLAKFLKLDVGRIQRVLASDADFGAVAVDVVVAAVAVDVEGIKGEEIRTEIAVLKSDGSGVQVSSKIPID
jgi:hypothetical protein